MGWRGTIVLALALLGALLALYRELLSERSDMSLQSVLQGTREAPPGEQITHLLAFDPATVTAVRLRRGGQEWHAERSADGWRGAERASDVDDFLANLLALAEIMPLEVAADQLADHGLDPPQAVVEVERSDAPPVVLLLGRRNPPSTGVYARVGADGRVVLTGALAQWDFDKATRALSPTAGAP